MCVVSAWKEVTARLLGEELLVDLAVIDLLLDGAAGDEAVHGHLALLPDAPCALSRLHVRARVPVWIVEQHPACPAPPCCCKTQHRYHCSSNIGLLEGSLLRKNKGHKKKKLFFTCPWQERSRCINGALCCI